MSISTKLMQMFFKLLNFIRIPFSLHYSTAKCSAKNTIANPKINVAGNTTLIHILSKEIKNDKPASLAFSVLFLFFKHKIILLIDSDNNPPYQVEAIAR